MGTVDQTPPLKIKQLDEQDYQVVWQAMQNFTKTRNSDTEDEIWVVAHPPTFTLGRNGKEEHILHQSNIPIIKVDRGGQVTYHGPGQLVVYFLLDLRRRNLGVRQLVTLIEDCLIALLEQYKLKAYSEKKAPGVYVDKKKIAALGLRVSKGCTSHGLSLNVDMDLTPFADINPCGYQGLEITQCIDLGINDGLALLAKKLVALIESSLAEAT